MLEEQPGKPPQKSPRCTTIPCYSPRNHNDSRGEHTCWEAKLSASVSRAGNTRQMTAIPDLCLQLKKTPKLSSATAAIKNHLQTCQSLMSCFARGRKTISRTAKQTTGISEMLDSANGCAAAPDAALDPNRDNFVTRNCTGISLFLHFSSSLIPS